MSTFLHSYNNYNKYRSHKLKEILLGVTTGSFGFGVTPIVVVASGTLAPAETELPEGFNRVEALGELLELRSGHGFDFLEV